MAIKMRTTLTVDDDVMLALQQISQESGQPFKRVLTDTLRLGLRARAQPAPSAYRLVAADLGATRAGVNLDKALSLAADLEDEALAHKLELRK